MALVFFFGMGWDRTGVQAIGSSGSWSLKYFFFLRV